MSTDNLDSADLKGVSHGGLLNEDVMQRIWDISKIPLPLTGMIGAASAKNSYKEWTQDDLANPDVNNAKVDGADTTGDDDTSTGARVGNHCQISTKTVKVSTRARSSDTIGRADELGYQVIMRQRELRRDVEAIMLTEQASQADNGDATPGKSAGLGAWLETNTSRGATGADGGFSNGVVAAPTDGTSRALTELMVRDVAELVYEEGGNPTVLMSIPKMIRKLSNYMFGANAGVASIQSNVGDKKAPAIATGAVGVFVTDHGVTMEFVPNRLQQPIDATDCNLFMLDPEYLELAFLHGYRVDPLAKTGLADKRQMAVDWTLIVKTEKAHGLIADLDYTQAVAAS